jgi:ABC-type sugar transport system permease subunit
MGRASAVLVLLFLIVLVFSLAVMQIRKKFEL